MKNSPKSELTSARFLKSKNQSANLMGSSLHLDVLLSLAITGLHWHLIHQVIQGINSERQQDRDGENKVWLAAFLADWKAGQRQGASLMETRRHTNTTQTDKWRWTSAEWRMKIDECLKERTNNPSHFSLHWLQSAMYCKELCGRVLKDWTGRWENGRKTIVGHTTESDGCA